MTSNTDLTAEARAEAKDLASDGAREIAGLYTRLADALEVAQGRITELEAENADLDSIARVNAMNFSDWQQAQTERERATADRDALAATLDAIRATAQRWIDGDPLNKWGDHTPHFLGLKLRALLGTVPADHLNTVKAEAWDECIRAFAWCLANGDLNGALQYVGEHNPYRRDEQGGQA